MSILRVRIFDYKTKSEKENRLGLTRCDTVHCPYGQCRLNSHGKMQCECRECSRTYSDQDIICASNGITYPFVLQIALSLMKKIHRFFLIAFRSTCHLEYDACTRHSDIKPMHMGPCNNCHNVTCPFNGQCQSEQGNHTCICPTRDTCPPVRVSDAD